MDGLVIGFLVSEVFQVRETISAAKDPSLELIEKNHRPNLNAFSWSRARFRIWVLKRAVRRPTGSTIGERVEAFQ